MALTHTQRTSMFNTLTEFMGQDDAETLMEHLPPSGWDNVATKDDLRVGFAELNAVVAKGFAQAAIERAEIRAEAAAERAQIRTEAAAERAQIRTEAATQWAEIRSETATQWAEIRSETATQWAEIIRRQVWHLYIVVSTIVLAAVSIWIALLIQPGAL